MCLVVADGTTETTQDVSEWAIRALEQGLVYVCAWGEGCDVVEDAVDWAFIVKPDSAERPIVLTTSHADETVADAVDFFAHDAKPVGAYRAKCPKWLLVEVGDFGTASGALDHLISVIACVNETSHRCARAQQVFLEDSDVGHMCKRCKRVRRRAAGKVRLDC